MSQNPFSPDEVPEWFQDLPPDIQQALVELGVAPREWLGDQIPYVGAAPEWVQQQRLMGYFGFISPAGLAPLYAGGMVTRAFTAGWLTPYGLDPGGYGYTARYQAALQTAAGYEFRAWGDPSYNASQASLWQGRAAYYGFQQNWTPIQEAWSAIRLGSYFSPELWKIRALGFPFYGAAQQLGAGAAMAPYVQAAMQADPTNTMNKILASPTFWPGQYPDTASTLFSGLGEWTGVQTLGWVLQGGITKANVRGILGVGALQAGLGIGLAPLATLAVRLMWGVPAFANPQEQEAFWQQEAVGWGLTGTGLAMVLRYGAFAARTGGAVSVFGPGSRIMESAGQTMFPSLGYARTTVGQGILDELGINTATSLLKFNENQILRYVETPLQGTVRRLLAEGMVPTGSNYFGPGKVGVWYRNPITGIEEFVPVKRMGDRWGPVSWEATGYTEAGAVRGKWGQRTWSDLEVEKHMGPAARMFWGTLGWYVGGEAGGLAAEAVSPYIPEGLGAAVTRFGGPISGFGGLITAMETSPAFARVVGTVGGGVAGSELSMRYGSTAAKILWREMAPQIAKQFVSSLATRLGTLAPLGLLGGPLMGVLVAQMIGEVSMTGFDIALQNWAMVNPQEAISWGKPPSNVSSGFYRTGGGVWETAYKAAGGEGFQVTDYWMRQYAYIPELGWMGGAGQDVGRYVPRYPTGGFGGNYDYENYYATWERKYPQLMYETRVTQARMDLRSQYYGAAAPYWDEVNRYWGQRVGISSVVTGEASTRTGILNDLYNKARAGLISWDVYWAASDKAYMAYAVASHFQALAQGLGYPGQAYVDRSRAAVRIGGIGGFIQLPDVTISGKDWSKYAPDLGLPPSLVSEFPIPRPPTGPYYNQWAGGIQYMHADTEWYGPAIRGVRGVTFGAISRGMDVFGNYSWDAYMNDQINEDQLLQNLISAGWTPDEAQVIVDDAIKRKAGNYVNVNVTFTAGLHGQLYGPGGGWQGKPTGWQAWDYTQKAAWIAAHPGLTKTGPVQPPSKFDQYGNLVGTVYGPHTVQAVEAAGGYWWTQKYGKKPFVAPEGYGEGYPGQAYGTRGSSYTKIGGKWVYTGGGATAYSQGYNTPVPSSLMFGSHTEFSGQARTVTRLVNGRWKRITEWYDPDKDNWVEIEEYQA